MSETRKNLVLFNYYHFTKIIFRFLRELTKRRNYLKLSKVVSKVKKVTENVGFERQTSVLPSGR